MMKNGNGYGRGLLAVSLLTLAAVAYDGVVAAERGAPPVVRIEATKSESARWHQVLAKRRDAEGSSTSGNLSTSKTASSEGSMGN